MSDTIRVVVALGQLALGLAVGSILGARCVLRLRPVDLEAVAAKATLRVASVDVDNMVELAWMHAKAKAILDGLAPRAEPGETFQWSDVDVNTRDGIRRIVVATVAVLADDAMERVRRATEDNT